MKGDVGGLLRAHNLKNRRATHTRERAHINGKITDTITLHEWEHVRTFSKHLSSCCLQDPSEREGQGEAGG